METSYNAQICRDEGRYFIQFETGSYKLFKKVEKACRDAVDTSDKERDKNRAQAMAALGHL